MAEGKTRTERAIEHLKGRLSPATVGKEMLDTLTDKIIPQGAAELAQAINLGGSGYVPYGAGQEPVEPHSGVHGAGPPEAIGPTPADVGITQESARHLMEEQQFDRAAGVERDSYAVRTPAEREAVLDRWQGMASATRDAHAETGTVPPMWAVMSRDEMKEVFTPERISERPSDISAKDRFLAEGPYQGTDVTEIGAPPATPTIKQPAQRDQQVDPLEQARSAARERSATQEKGKHRQQEIG